MEAPTPGLKLEALIARLAQKNPVVMLIDEYDYALINNATNQTIAKENHTVLHAFYSALKGLDGCLKAIYITGVTKYARTSLFSGLNNLNDLSFDPRAASLLGYSKEEIQTYFYDSLKQLAERENVSQEELLERMKAWYDGYRFSKDPHQYVYNPFSVLYCLQKQEFSNYWFESGTPTFLVELLKKHPAELEDIKEIKLSSSTLGPFDIGELPLIPILFQAGYLTISDHCQIKEGVHSIELYTLKYPNLEVAESFKKYLLAALINTTYKKADIAATDLMRALHCGNIDAFIVTMKSLIAHIPYNLHIPEEKYYHSLFQLLASVLNYEPYSEVLTDHGRIDMVIETNNRVYIFEIKYNTSANTALEQIMDRTYFERFQLTKKKIVLVGIAFNRINDKLILHYKTKELIS